MAPRMSAEETGKDKNTNAVDIEPAPGASWYRDGGRAAGPRGHAGAYARSGKKTTGRPLGPPKGLGAGGPTSERSVGEGRDAERGLGVRRGDWRSVCESVRSREEGRVRVLGATVGRGGHQKVGERGSAGGSMAPCTVRRWHLAPEPPPLLDPGATGGRGPPWRWAGPSGPAAGAPSRTPSPGRRHGPRRRGET